MIRLIVVILFLVITLCKSSTSDNGHLSVVSKSDSVLTTQNDTVNYDYATYFIVIADTSLNYYTLQKKMFELNKQYHLTIDTMGRYYNKEKDLIALPDNDEDEMYAGSYFPRRDASKYLSIEYLNFYSDKLPEKTIALITGIYENETSADSAGQSGPGRVRYRCLPRSAGR